MNVDAARFVIDAEPGTRVVVRRRIEGGVTDAVGYLRSCDGAVCMVETKRGLVAITLADIVAAKEVPPPPAPRPRRRLDD
ncbi:ferrous iron transport protein A [Cryobacterium mannosilyticum]|uniref:Ferrous iron transport protein A n=1 Tax=Cryobacterium mannosilyticum TaxID=1259190 RepID=A0A4R8WAK0_9MICO|nr:ferrous iron transport protein A [Cryobacterium mannosilyticum]TFC03772.1 ferrous iron transport protein A [Cryobacterium mannosilyticum]